LDRLGEGGDVARNPDEFVRRKNLYECVSSVHHNLTSCLTDLRALEEIKSKLQLVSEGSAAAEGVEKEGSMTAVCDLADDLRDAIVEYQVRNNTGKRTLWFTYGAVCSLRSRGRFTSRLVN